jgi:BioD-like phosphotransacetylase family protein
MEGKPVDEDTLHMKEILNLEEPLESITPILLDYQYLDQYPMVHTASLREKISRAHQRVAAGKDLIIIEALKEPGSGSSINLSAMDLARIFGSHLMLLTTTHKDTVVDEILFKHSCISQRGTKCCGAIFNQVRKPVDDRIRNVIVPTLERLGIRVWGLIPESITLTAPTVEELLESLGGEVLCGEENLSNLVERYLVGAMTQETAIRYLRRTPKKAVIAGGDRPDIALAALETDTSALILTGNLHPNVRVLSKAKEKGVPIILVSYDTYTTVDMVRDVTGKIRGGDKKRINEAKRLASEYVDWKELLSRTLKDQ